MEVAEEVVVGMAAVVTCPDLEVVACHHLDGLEDHPDTPR